MSFEILTLDEKHALLIALYQALLPDDDVSQDSHEWKWLRTQAMGGTDNDAHTEAVKNDLMPDTSADDLLVRWANIRGVIPKGATPARKSQALRIYGTATTPVPANIQFTYLNSLRFQSGGADVIGPGDYVDVDVAGVDVGSQTRLSAGSQLTMVDPIAGLNEIAILQLDMDEDGTDAESQASIRSRLLSRFSSPPLGGAQEDYVQWALEQTGIAAAFCYPLRAGLGTVDVTALHAGSGTDRLLSGPEIGDLQAALDALRPVSVKAFRVLTVNAETNNIAVLLTPDGAAQNEFDWDDSTPPGGAGNTWDAVTGTLTFAAARPATMAAGNRVIFSDGATGRERVIEALSGTNAIILEPDAEGDVPTATTTVYSGGPLVQPVRVAIQALVDALGTANPDSKRYGTWEGSLDPDKIGEAAGSVPGVLRRSVTTPAALVDASDPAYPDDGSVGLIIAGQILVRRKW